MHSAPYQPVFELTRGDTVESIHIGAAAVVNPAGDLVAWFGDPDLKTFLRSTAKPLQILSFLEHGGQAHYNLTPPEIAIMCASHSGTDEHVKLIQSIQKKTGVTETDLLCGVHPPMHEPTAEALRKRKELPTPNRHNCSGKHTGMVAYARMLDLPVFEYLNPAHPIQQAILEVVSEMCGLPVQQIGLGTDGCSAPNFALPLRNVAWAFARLCDPEAGGVQPAARAAACRTVTSAMMSNPDLVGGPARFDTLLMQTGKGRIVVKGGAEAFQGIGLMPGALGPGSAALGIALKIADGDPRSRAYPAVALEVLHQLGALDSQELALLANFGPVYTVLNWRKLEVGQAHPCFQMEYATS